MAEIQNYRRSIIYISIILSVLIMMIAIGFTLGFLSEDPDGLERTLIDAKGESWLDNLSSPWDPVLGWINNEYIEGMIGIFLSVLLIICPFYLIILVKRRKYNEYLLGT